MKVLFLAFSALLAVANGDEPPLVSAVVRELTHDPASAPLENRNIPGRQPPVWNVRLEVLDVLRGDPKLKGQMVITACADTLPQGNGRFVTPRLNEGDLGIWAVKQLADGSWAETYSPYEVEKGVRLPLIKGRHDAYENVLSRLSGGESSQPRNDVKALEEPRKTAAETSAPPHVRLPAPEKALEAKPAPAMPGHGPASSPPWKITAVLIVAAAGLAWLLLKRRS